MQRNSRAVRVSGFLFASALCAGAAGAGPVFMKLEGVDVPGRPGGGGEIEIESFSWGSTNSNAALGGWSKADGLDVTWQAPGATATSHGGQRLKMQPGGGQAGAANKDMVLKGSKIGENAPRGSGANQMSMEDTAGKEKARRGTRTVGGNESITIGGGRTEGDPDRPVIAGTVPNPSASRRQHGTVTISKEWGAATPQLAKPKDKGSVWVRVASPWTACRAGARYPAIELGDGKATYRLSDVVVTSCAAGGASLDYARVKVRAWGPEKKED